MSNERAKGFGSGRMSGPDLIYTATSQASAAGGITPYAMVSCFGAKSITFIIRTAAGIPTISSSTMDISPHAGLANVTGVATESNGIDYVFGGNGTIHVAPGSTQGLYASTNLRFWCDRIGPRVQLAASATGVSCWSVIQWD